MAKSRRKSNGCRRGTFKLKRMGKGWSTLRRPPGRPAPVDRSESDKKDEKADSSES
ncbi:MAG: hypothetical protein AAF196_16480 [Planctomycetota bacterium]